MNLIIVSRTSQFVLLVLIYWQCLFAIFIPKVASQDYVDECPEPNGFYADAVQCDRYYECKNSQILDKLCPDGLVFDESSIQFAKCSFPFSIDCADRQELQTPQPTPLCPRQNGYFAHKERCDQFYFCDNGVGHKITCPESLIFSPENGQCAYSDQLKREGCSSSDFFQFSCPNDPNSPHAHPRYPDPTDCQYFFLCLDKKEARRNGCQTGLVFNPKTSSCDRQENLEVGEECRTYYNETFIDHLRASGSAGVPGVPGGGLRGGTGIKLDTSNRKRVSVVRRKKRPENGASSNIEQSSGVGQPARRRPALPNTGVTGSGAGSLATRRVPADSRVRAQQASLSQQNFEDRRVSPPVRTRVRRPNLPGFSSQQNPTEAPGPPAPPQFSLSDAEAIQRFRDSNRFAPDAIQTPTRESSTGSTGGGRLTVLSANNFRRRNPVANDDSVFRQQPEDDPKSGFGSFSAVPETTGNFGNRFRSRRPPTFETSNRDINNERDISDEGRRNPASQEVKTLPVRRTVGGNSERIQQVEFEDDGGFGAFDRRTRNPTAEEIRSLPVRRHGASGESNNGRLEVTKIEVRPQFDLAEVVGDALDRQEGLGSSHEEGQFASAHSFESSRQRSRPQG